MICLNTVVVVWKCENSEKHCWSLLIFEINPNKTHPSLHCSAPKTHEHAMQEYSRCLFIRTKGKQNEKWKWKTISLLTRAKPMLLAYGAEATWPLHPFSDLPTSRSHLWKAFLILTRVLKLFPDLNLSFPNDIPQTFSFLQCLSAISLSTVFLQISLSLTYSLSPPPSWLDTPPTADWLQVCCADRSTFNSVSHKWLTACHRV